MEKSIEEAKEYLEKKEIPELFEAIITSLMYSKPDDHIDFIQECLIKIKSENVGNKSIKWDSFIDLKKQTVLRAQSSKSRDERVQSSKDERLPSSQRRDDRISSSRSKTEKELQHVVEARKLSGLSVKKSLSNLNNLESRVKSGKSVLREKSAKSEIRAISARNEVRTKSARPFKACEIIFVVGGPGSGKGTQCERIAQRFGFVHLSSGDLLRAEVESGSDLGQEMNNIMKSGGLVPDEVILEIIKNKMANSLSSSNRFLLDGYPRKVDQALKFERLIAPCSLAIYINASDETMKKRLLKRALTSGRADDNEETIIQRLITFHESTEPVIEHYRNKGKLRDIPCEGAPDEIFVEIENVINTSFMLRDKLIIFVIGGPGSGKGTQCDRIVSKYGFKHLSSGDLLRAEVESGSQLGNDLNETMREGKLVPLEVTLSLIKAAILANCGNYNGFLIDGYPRDVIQGKRFENEIRHCDLALYLYASDDVMTDRLLERGKTSGRVDDNKKTIQNRLNLFHQVTEPVIEYYRTNGKLKNVNSEQRPDDVFKEVQIVIDELMASSD